MVRIKSFIGDNHRNLSPHSTEVDVEYQTFINERGQQIFQLTSFASHDKGRVGSSSQVFQLDKEVAEKLIQILRDSFKI